MGNSKIAREGEEAKKRKEMVGGGGGEEEGVADVMTTVGISKFKTQNSVDSPVTCTDVHS